MSKLYMRFYEEQTRKLHQDEMKDIDLAQFPFLTRQNPYVMLKPDILIGRIDHKRTFGFLRQTTDDIYIEQAHLGDAMHDDIVLVRDGMNPKVELVLKRALTTIIATVKKTKHGFDFDAEIYLDRPLIVDKPKGLVTGHVVMLQVDEIRSKSIQTHVDKIIGHHNDPDIETMKIVHAYQWPLSFDDNVMSFLQNLVIDHHHEQQTRLDLTDQLIVTIDGKDAKDLDDAISLEVKDGQVHLGVHIADVSHYVRPDTPLDEAAYERSTSVYLADRVMPMLPHLLSNDLCSLNPHERKYTLSCLMVLDQEAKVVSYKIEKTIIESKRRLNYDEVNAFLKKGTTLSNKTLETMLTQMNELSQKLKIMRKKRGEIEFESTEIGFVVDKKGRVLDVYERVTDEAEELIESLMLVANETVASHMQHANLPALYRIHEKPDVEKLRTALLTIQKLGFPVNLKQLGNPRPLQHLTKTSAQTAYGPIIHMLLLRSMQKAKYSEVNDIHYGLGARHYSHFTSPIRRYPDLMLHRMIHLFVLGESKRHVKDIKHYKYIMHDIAQHTSDQERKAIQMERDVAKLKSCEFLLDKLGQRFKATITQMMPSGMFVRLQNGIEGFVPLRELNDYFSYHEANLVFVGNRGTRYRLGDEVTVELISVDLAARKMDFTMVEKTRPKKRRASS